MVQVRLLLGPAGSGKTFRCLGGIRKALAASPGGAPLLLVVPKQSTWQMERQLLASSSTPGYTRLHILSFERLAHFVFARLRKQPPEMLNEEGRLMVLRGLLAQKRDELKLFRASARLTGFAQELSRLLKELQRKQLTPQSLLELAGQVQNVEGLPAKLQDLATLLECYLNWLKTHDLKDVDTLLAAASQALAGSTNPRPRLVHKSPQLSLPLGLSSSDPAESDAAGSSLLIEQIWVDAFAEFSPQELDLLAGLLPRCQGTTLTFCLDRAPEKKSSWLSNWSVVQQTFEDCKSRLGLVPGAELSVELLRRDPPRSRFSNNPTLQHLESCWSQPQPYAVEPPAKAPGVGVPEPREREASPAPPPTEERAGKRKSFARSSVSGVDDPKLSIPSTFPLRLAACANPEAEATLAAREIIRYVRSGGRYRDASVLVRQLDRYHDPLQRVFMRYEIPFFLDRRESVSHHPVAELSRSALRTVAFDWQHEDWFAVLKTGLVPVPEDQIDRLENEALARGWKGDLWQKPLVVETEPQLTSWLADLQGRIVPPFQRFALALASHRNQPTGPQIGEALRQLWSDLDVELKLEEWAAPEFANSQSLTAASVHSTLWDQMNEWLGNVELAFPHEPLRLREWLPILDAGLANLSVGVIPPALDQVLIGAIDRSRNPDVKLALVLGLNETVFPASPQVSPLLSETDRAELEKRNVILASNARQQLSRERFFGYLACTRARERLVLTYALFDANGSPLNPSPFLSHLRQLFPLLETETIPETLDWAESEHPSELIVPLLKAKGQDSSFDLSDQAAHSVVHLPAVASVLESLRDFHTTDPCEALATELAACLYGPVLRTSVSRIEQFAACPFRFFVHSGLRAEERKNFELDIREQGSFQHEALALFHDELHREGKRWRDITPAEARKRISRIALGLMTSYRGGLLQTTQESRFTGRVLSQSLENFVDTLVNWMRGQYQFDPVKVEWAFGDTETAPAWELPLAGGKRLALKGRIDRVDLWRDPATGAALLVIVDYKSSQKQLDPVLVEHGLHLQLLAYLNVLRRWPNPEAIFGSANLQPAGVFYVSLRGKYEREPNRLRALAEIDEARKLAYRHSGRFDLAVLPQLDARPNARQGDQFNYRVTDDGLINKNSREAMDSIAFIALLDSVEMNLHKMGDEIFSGVAKVDPYRKGLSRACDQCDYQAICRIDPWTHTFRVLK